MRQTLLRLSLDQLWTMNNSGGILHVGVGWLLVPWLLYGLISFWLTSRQQPDRRRSLVQSLVVWGGGSLVILLVPTFVPRHWAPNGIPVWGYGFMLFIGFLAGAWTAARRAQSVGLNQEILWDLAMWLFFAGIIGSRLFFLLQYHQRVFADKHGFELLLAAVNLPDGGLVLYGGIILGIATFVAFCRYRDIPALLMADIVMPSLLLGMAFGRIGCFLNGCCYGDRCGLPWGVSFAQGSVPWMALVDRGFLSPDAQSTFPLHPTQLYSAVNEFILAALTATYFRYRPRNGAVLAVGWISYPVTRFVIEYLRGDELGKFNTPLTIAQWVSIALVTTGLLYAAWLSRTAASDAPSKIGGPRTSDAVMRP